MTVDSILNAMEDPKEWRPIIDEETRRHPNLTSQDVHKLVYQAVHGGNHLLQDRGQFASAFHTEWDRTSPAGELASAIQCIDPRGRTARIHLAPCKAAGVDPDVLVALLADQPLKQGTTCALEAAWEAVRMLARQGQLPISEGELAFPATRAISHHSTTYGPAAYRIVHDLKDHDTQETLCRLGLAH